MKLPGYDTLRLVLAKSVLLVEGPSDELVVQRAYCDTHNGRLPIQDGVDVISVRGLSFKRFLDIARLLKKKIAVITDNDGRPHTEVEARYADYSTHDFITIHVGCGEAFKTLEPQILDANDRATINTILGTKYATDELLIKYMTANKATVALKIFESETSITMPGYIQRAVA